MYKLDKQAMTLKVQAKDKIVLTSVYNREVSNGYDLNFNIIGFVKMERVERLANEKYSILFLRTTDNVRLKVIGETEYLQQFVKDYKEFLEELA